MVATDWIKRTLAGDPNAFKMIFDQYKNLVFKTAYLILESTDEAEDALQEIFIKVYHSLESYQISKGAFSTWLYRISVNHCLNRRRRTSRSKETTEAFKEKANAQYPSFEDRFSDQQILQSALSRLSNKLRTVIVLRYYLDLSYSEIAQILEIPLGTVKSRISTGLKEMQKTSKWKTLKIISLKRCQNELS
jgi:RNA polymerase sigma factor (sigma-70 family)